MSAGPLLRLHSVDPLFPGLGWPVSPECVAEVSQAVLHSTGWPLEWTDPAPSLLDARPKSGGQKHAPSFFQIGNPEAIKSAPVARADISAAKSLCDAFNHLLAELTTAQRTIREREADLAVQQPWTSHPEELTQLESRLTSSLKGACDALQCHAAAVYMLDSSSRELKLRVVHGLPEDRLTAPARLLQQCPADLEALSGHVVVGELEAQNEFWQPPESYPSWVCVPIASATLILGTMWVYSEHGRAFSDDQTNVVEIVAGRIAAELEREHLRRENERLRAKGRRLAPPTKPVLSHIPTQAPALEGWQLAAWLEPAGELSGEFFDWLLTKDGSLVVHLGDVRGCDYEAALGASRLSALMHAHARYAKDPSQVLRQSNRSLRATSLGDQLASACCAWLEPRSGKLQLAASGDIWAVLLKNGQTRNLFGPSEPLGFAGRPQLNEAAIELDQGDSLILASDGLRDALDDRGRLFGMAGLDRAIQSAGGQSAKDLAKSVRDQLAAHGPRQEDATIVVLRRSLHGPARP